MRHRMVVPPGARRDDFPLKRKGNRDPVPGFRSAERRRLVPAEPYEKESERDLGPRLRAASSHSTIHLCGTIRGVKN